MLPPSAGKADPARHPAAGPPLEIAALSLPALGETRSRVLDALVELARGPLVPAMAVLGLGPSQTGEVRRDAGLRDAATLPASQLYTGVLYRALDLSTLPLPARTRAQTVLLTVSALFGWLRPDDRIPAYRLAMSTSLPGIGRLAGVWRPVLSAALPGLGRSGLLVDLRSSAYAAAFRPGPELAGRTVSVRVVREHQGRRTVVSHHAKHTRGLIARHLLETGAQPRSAGALAEALGVRWVVELHPRRLASQPWSLDVVETLD